MENADRRPVGSHLAIVLLCAVAGLLACASPASAARSFEGQITEAGSSEPLRDPFGLAVDSGDHLWVTETSILGGTVDKYSPTGSWEAHTSSPPWGNSTHLESIAFDGADAKMFVSESNQDALYGLDLADASYDGTELKPLGATTGEPLRVAADNSGGPYDGDLYVFADRHVIRIDGATGAPVDFTEGSSAGSNELSGADTPNGSFAGFQASFGIAVAVDSVGHLWVANSPLFSGLPNVIDEFAPTGRHLRSITETGPSEPLGEQLALAIDPTTGNLLASNGNGVDEFTPAGAFLETTTASSGGSLIGLAVDSTGKLYAAGALPESAPGPPVIDIWGPAGPPAPKHLLTVEVTGEGDVSGPAGIVCTEAGSGSSACEGEFTKAAEVPLSATPAAGYGLAEWVTVEGNAGSCTGAITSCETAALTETTKLKAVFVPTHKLRVDVTGAGEVNSSPAGIDGCREAVGACEASFNEGTVVALTATPAAGSTFSGWSGGGCSGTGTCKVSLSADAKVIAAFAKVPPPPPSRTHKLTVKRVGSGKGSVADSTGAISCPSTCSHSYAGGTQVTLTATPAPGSTLSGWSGGGCSGTGVCQLTIRADTKVSAHFKKATPPAPVSARLRIRHVRVRCIRRLTPLHPAGRVCAKLKIAVRGTIAAAARGAVSVRATVRRRGRRVTATKRAPIVGGRWRVRLVLLGIPRGSNAPIYIRARFGGSPGVQSGHAKRRVRLG